MHVRWQRQVPVGLAGELHDPPPRPERLDELDRRGRATTAEPLARAQPSRGPGERLPALVPTSLDEQHLHLPARFPPKREAGGDDARVVDDRQVSPELLGKLCERPLPDVAGAAFVDEQPRRVAPLSRPLGDQLGRERVVEVS